MRRHSCSAKTTSSLEVMKKRNSTDCTVCGDVARAATQGPFDSNSSFPQVTPLEVLRKIFASKAGDLDPAHTKEGLVASRIPNHLSPPTAFEAPPCFPKTLSLSELRERLGARSSENSRKGGDNVAKPPEIAPDCCELSRNSSTCSASSSVLGAPPISPKKVLGRKLIMLREYISHLPRNEKGQLKFSDDSVKGSSSSSSSALLAVPTPRKKLSLLDLLRAGGTKHPGGMNKKESPEESDGKNCGPFCQTIMPNKASHMVAEEGKCNEVDDDTDKYSCTTSRGIRDSSEKRVENHGGSNNQSLCSPSLCSSLSRPVQDPKGFSASGRMAYPSPNSLIGSSSAHCRQCPQRNGEADTSTNVISHETSSIRPMRRRGRTRNSDSDIDSSVSSSGSTNSSPSRVRKKIFSQAFESPSSRKNVKKAAEEQAKNEMTEEKPHGLDSGSRFLVFDTSSLIRADIGILNMCSEKYIVCIPYAVLHEIDIQIKHGSFGRRPVSSELRAERPGGTPSATMPRPFNSKFSLTDDQLKGQAMKVRDWIYGAQQSSRGIRVQKRSEVNETYFRSALSNDDHILGYAVFLKDEHIHPTYFITDDKLLATKAIAELGRGAVYNYESLRTHMGVRMRGNF